MAPNKTVLVEDDLVISDHSIIQLTILCKELSNRFSLGYYLENWKILSDSFFYFFFNSIPVSLLEISHWIRLFFLFPQLHGWDEVYNRAKIFEK